MSTVAPFAPISGVGSSDQASALQNLVNAKIQPQDSGMQISGCFITLEGVEGVGKSTCVPHIAEFLQARGLEVVTTREPGGTAVAESIRQILLWTEDEQLDHVTELLLHFASRRQNLCEVIRPALARGAFVVCDRFTDATHAYQGGGRRLATEWIDQLSSIVHPNMEPDLTLLFNLEPEEGLKRIASNKSDRYESETPDFMQRVRQRYLDRAIADRFALIDASEDASSVRSKVLAAVERLLESRK